MPQTAEHPVAVSTAMLVYDGACGFCNRSLQFILRHERRHDLRFVPRDSPLGLDLRRHFHLETAESMLWIEHDSVAIESEAVLRAALYLGGVWAILGNLGLMVPSFVRNWAYRLIARNRRRLSVRSTSCLVPTAEQRARFLS